MSAPAMTTVVITDTNVLINFLHIGQLALLGESAQYFARDVHSSSVNP